MNWPEAAGFGVVTLDAVHGPLAPRPVVGWAGGFGNSCASAGLAHGTRIEQFARSTPAADMRRHLVRADRRTGALDGPTCLPLHDGRGDPRAVGRDASCAPTAWAGRRLPRQPGLDPAA